MEFNESLALQLLESEIEFPVNFDDAWQWLNYHDKGTAKRALLNCGFEENIDFRIYAEATTTGISANPRQNIFLTVSCFKEWCMMSGTEKGKEVRLYFLKCEKLLKERIKAEQSLTQSQLSIQLTNFIQQQQEMNVKLLERTVKLDKIEEAHNINLGIKGVINDEVENSYPDDVSTTVNDYLISKKIDLCYAPTLAKRAAQFMRCARSKDVLAKNNKNQTLYVGNQISYLDEALRTILDI